jgi:hypothetical protein
VYRCLSSPLLNLNTVRVGPAQTLLQDEHNVLHLIVSASKMDAAMVIRSKQQED